MSGGGMVWYTVNYHTVVSHHALPQTASQNMIEENVSFKNSANKKLGG